MNKYKIATEQAKALMGCSSMINTDGRVFDITQEDGQAYVIWYKGDDFFEALQYLKVIFSSLSRKFDYDKPLYGSKPVTGDEFIY